MSKQRLKEFTFSAFDGGINWQNFSSGVADNELSDCLNMYFDDGALITRPGIRVINEAILSEENEGFEIKSLGSVNYGDDCAMKLFLVSRVEDNAYYNKILAVKTDGSYTYFKLATFYSNNYTNGIDKINCIAFSGKETNGSGIYIVVAVIDTTNSICDKYIYEVNTDYSAVTPLNASEIYAPLVYVNGRGASYSELSTSKKTFPTPKVLENFNMLSSGFRTSFTTDGLSTHFYLPAKNLSSQSGENMEISYTDNNGSLYKWIIPYSETSSSFITIGEQSYRFSVNRSAGTVYAVDSTSSVVALPMAEGMHNNLVVKAYKTPESDRVYKMTVSESFNSRVFLSGYSNEGNVICFSKRNNPLYFPTSSISYFGDKSSNVVAIKQQNDRLIVFKPHQIGVCSSVSYSEYNVDSILKGTVSRASVTEKLEVKTVNSTVGCIYPDTILSCANRLIFWGSDKRVYTITSTSNYLQRFHRISDKIDSRLSHQKVTLNAFALDYNGRYMLFVDNICYNFDYNASSFLAATTTTGSKSKKDMAWFYFNYSFGLAKPFYAMRYNNDIVILTRVNAYGGAYKVICYTFGGFEDQKVNSLTEYEYASIRSNFSTAASNLLDEHLKRIVGLEMTFTQEMLVEESTLNIDYFNENKSAFIGAIKPPMESMDAEIVIKKAPCVYGSRRFGIALDRDYYFGIKQVKVIYKLSE